MKLGVVYMHVSPSGKRYIGQTWDMKQRWALHQRRTGGCPAFRNALHKYGKMSFRTTILGEASTQEALDILEASCIARHNSIVPNGYNLRAGGSGGTLSQVTREKLRAAAIARYQRPDEKERMRQAQKIAGNKPSAEAAKKSILTRSTDEFREKMRVLTIARLSLHPEQIPRGKKRSPEQIEHMRQAASRRGPPTENQLRALAAGRRKRHPEPEL